ncbi:hypothetical protein OIS18_004444 [Salmonella enterica]|nr:hypothetical protein [Salmonella enterica]
MSDWRRKQRTGKSKFLPLLDEINARLNTGETVKQIYISYKESMAIELSYVQFTRYVNKYCKDNNIHLTKMNDDKRQNKTKQKNNEPENKNKFGDDFNDYMNVCYQKEKLVQQAIENDISVETISSWGCANFVQVSNALGNYIRNKR